jgi:hypothetical protein
MRQKNQINLFLISPKIIYKIQSLKNREGEW